MLSKIAEKSLIFVNSSYQVSSGGLSTEDIVDFKFTTSGMTD
jgi:hypothetical protein